MKNKNLYTVYIAACLLLSALFFSFQTKLVKKPQKKPNILFAIADDQSFPHAGAYGSKLFQTPAFDQVASEGVLFMNAFVVAPQCSPSRAALLTGRNIWQLEEAGTHSSYFPKKFPVFTDALENAGYFRGYTGKPWGPGNWKDSGWKQNPVGPEYNKINRKVPTTGIHKTDYVANFKAFLAEKPADQPFFFWFGSFEPHREYEYGTGKNHGLSEKDLKLPAFLPNNDTIRQDFMDYALEIGWFDQQLAMMLQILKDAGEYENTIIVVTADNGMPFPYAKANLQEFGTHVPLAISGPGIKGKRVSNDLISMVDLTPTFLELGGAPKYNGLIGKSILPLLRSEKPASRKYVLTGRERHTHARPDNLGYPARAIRTHQYLYIKNFKPELWPQGDPRPVKTDNSVAGKDSEYKEIGFGYEDIDDSPSKASMLFNQKEIPHLFQIGFEKRPSEELYDIITDPFCLKNLAHNASFKGIKSELSKILMSELIKQGDPRTGAHGNVFDSYPRFGKMRNFAGFKQQGAYNEAFK